MIKSIKGIIFSVASINTVFATKNYIPGTVRKKNVQGMQKKYYNSEWKGPVQPSSFISLSVSSYSKASKFSFK